MVSSQTFYGLLFSHNTSVTDRRTDRRRQPWQQLDRYLSTSSSSSRREAFSRSIPPLRFVARTSDLLPAAERQSLIFPCLGRSDGSKWWEIDHERVSNQEMAGCRLGLRSKSEGSDLLERPLWVWQHDQTVRVFVCERWQRLPGDRTGVRLHC